MQMRPAIRSKQKKVKVHTAKMCRMNLCICNASKQDRLEIPVLRQICHRAWETWQNLPKEVCIGSRSTPYPRNMAYSCCNSRKIVLKMISSLNFQYWSIVRPSVSRLSFARLINVIKITTRILIPHQLVLNFLSIYQHRVVRIAFQMYEVHVL